MDHPDFCIAGAGIIGLSLALELQRRGASVTILERAAALAEASTAAAGMLAASDPENPPQLQSLSALSVSLYPGYLAYIESLSKLAVPFQTSITLQSVPSSSPIELPPYIQPGPHTFRLLEEHSIDPRQLGQALLAAVQATSIDLRLHAPIVEVRSLENSIEIQTPAATLTAHRFIDCTGSWAATSSRLPPHAVEPRKGQMLAVALPPTLPVDVVVRTPDIYVVPRTFGPNAGRALIGATIEDCGFDKTVHSPDIKRLHSLASKLIPQLTSVSILEAWAGLRPSTFDGLPLLGALADRPHHLLATGHYRNGILLAPATAHLIAQLLFEEQPSLNLAPFSPDRTLSFSR